MRMGRRFGENIFDNPLGQFAGALILFQNDPYRHAGFDIRAGLSIYCIHSWNQ